MMTMLGFYCQLHLMGSKQQAETAWKSTWYFVRISAENTGNLSWWICRHFAWVVRLQTVF